MKTVNALTESLPAVRVTPQMKARLEGIAEQSVAKSVSDHIRFALTQYIELVENQTEPVKALR